MISWHGENIFVRKGRKIGCNNIRPRMAGKLHYGCPGARCSATSPRLSVVMEALSVGLKSPRLTVVQGLRPYIGAGFAGRLHRGAALLSRYKPYNRKRDARVPCWAAAPWCSPTLVVQALQSQAGGSRSRMGGCTMVQPYTRGTSLTIASGRLAFPAGRLHRGAALQSRYGLTIASRRLAFHAGRLHHGAALQSRYSLAIASRRLAFPAGRLHHGAALLSRHKPCNRKREVRVPSRAAAPWCSPTLVVQALQSQAGGSRSLPGGCTMVQPYTRGTSLTIARPEARVPGI